MSREFKRACKIPDCGQEFVVSAPSIEEDRALGLSEPEYCPKHRLLQVRSYSRVACHHIELQMTSEGEEMVREVESRKGIGAGDGEELRGAIFDPLAPRGLGFGPGGLGAFKRPIRVFVENKKFTPTKTKSDFKIAEKADEILEALETHQVIVLVGTTGSGKSTYIPWLLLTGGEPGKLSKWASRGPICVTQPRIQATRLVPEFIANCLNGTSLGVGSQVGFSHSGTDEYDRRTRLIFKTDGKLINDIVSSALANYSVLMIDEAHERSVNIDLILGLMKDQLYLYPQLRLIIASATIDHESFVNFYGGAEAVPFIESRGIQHPVQKHWWGAEREPTASEGVFADWWKKVNAAQLPARQQLPRAIGEMVSHICRLLDQLSPRQKQQEDGHILVFLPGSREIDQTVSIINAQRLPNVIALPLYAQRPLHEQTAALSPTADEHPEVYGKRRVVVSTNVAETSLTVEGIKHVIDAGYIKESYWNPATQVQELQTVRHSKAGCRQRWGRAGRMSPGHAYMLYTEADFDDFPDASTPEIARSSLEQVLLTAKASGVRTRDKGPELAFDWMPLKSEVDRSRFHAELSRAYGALRRQHAIDSDGDLTPFGLELRGIPAELHVARLCLEAERHGMGVEAATLLPFLRLQFGLPSLLKWDREWSAYEKHAVRTHQLDLVFGCKDDLDLFIKIWLLWETKSGRERQEWAAQIGLDVGSFTKSIAEERHKLLEAMKDWRKAEERPPSLARLDALRALIAYCLPNEIYVPAEDRPVPGDSIDRRFETVDLLEWQAMWDETSHYEEYDDDVSFEESYVSKNATRSGVYRRLSGSLDNPAEGDSVELAPTSICAGSSEAAMLVICQRRANFNHPARTKVIGMNNIRIDPSWLPAIRGSLVERCDLYANLSRRLAPKEHSATAHRLFMSEVLPQGAPASGVVIGPSAAGRVALQVVLPRSGATDRLFDRRGAGETVPGCVPAAEVEFFSKSQLVSGASMLCTVIGHEIDPAGSAIVLLSGVTPVAKAVKEFARRHRVGDVIDVKMMRVLEDPLGKNTVFVVREVSSGIDIPVADTDLCSDTVPRDVFGRRFAPGESFKVRVEAVDADAAEVRVSRGQELIKEYLALLSGQDSRVMNLEVRRIEAAGLYVGVPKREQDCYIGFVRHALWPLELPKQKGATYEALVRRSERQFPLAEIGRLAADGNVLPAELDLSINCDFTLPLAYARFATVSRVGDLVPVTVDRYLDGGGLLVSLNAELKAIIWDSELGLDSVGRLLRARSYTLGSELRARVFQMKADRKAVRVSLLRVAEPPPILTPGTVIEASILLVRPHFKETGSVELTCAVMGKYGAKVTGPLLTERPLAARQRIMARIRRIDRTNLIDAEFVDRVEPGSAVSA